MTKFHTLWNVWIIIYIVIINLYLTYSTINSYIQFKYKSNDPVYGKEWNIDLCYIVLGSLITALSIFPFIIYFYFTNHSNISNGDDILGVKCQKIQFLVDADGHSYLIPSNYKLESSTKNKGSQCGLNNRLLKLLYCEFPPIAYFLHFIAAFCFMVPRLFIEAHYIKNKVVTPNRVWHTDLDVIFHPDQVHKLFLLGPEWITTYPLSPAYFNVVLALMALSLRYSRCFWYTSKGFSLFLSFIMVLTSIVILLDICSTSVLINFAINSHLFLPPLQVTTDPYLLIFLCFASSIFLLLSSIPLFHYGLLQYGDAVLGRLRKSLRNNKHINNNAAASASVGMTTFQRGCQLTGNGSVMSDNCSDHDIKQQANIAGPMSDKSASTNDSSTNEMRHALSKTFTPHLAAFCLLLIVVSIKSYSCHIAYSHLYATERDCLALTTIVVLIGYAIVMVIVWFALALRRSWKFQVSLLGFRGNNPQMTNGVTQPPSAQQMFYSQSGETYPLNNKNLPMGSMLVTSENLIRHQMTNNGSQIMLLPIVNNNNMNNTSGSMQHTHNTDVIGNNNNRHSNMLDGASDDTDISSRISSNNYVMLQSMRQHNNGGGQFEGGQLRTPIYLSYSNNMAAVTNGNNMPHHGMIPASGCMYANINDTPGLMAFSGLHPPGPGNPSLHQQRSSLADESQMGSEHSFGSSHHRQHIGGLASPFFDNLPPTLPNFDENRYRNLNTPTPTNLAIDKLIPRYMQRNNIISAGVAGQSDNDSMTVPLLSAGGCVTQYPRTPERFANTNSGDAMSRSYYESNAHLFLANNNQPQSSEFADSPIKSLTRPMKSVKLSKDLTNVLMENQFDEEDNAANHDDTLERNGNAQLELHEEDQDPSELQDPHLLESRPNHSITSNSQARKTSDKDKKMCSQV